MQLNAKQQAVVQCDEHCLAIACPGAGKTTTMAAKVIRLLLQGQRVVAVTFTRDAADALRQKIVQSIKPIYFKNLIVATFHLMCLLMAFPKQYQKRTFGSNILKDSYSPFTSSWYVPFVGEQKLLVQDVIKSLSLPYCVADAMQIIEQIKAKGGETSQIEPDVLNLYALYQKKMQEKGWIDFYEMILLTNQALKQKTLSPLAVDAILVDEFQDTDINQLRWIKYNVTPGVKVTAVGDDDQAIYGFRHSLGYSGMVEFVRYFGAKKIFLDTNYRSHQEILIPAVGLIQHNQERLNKNLKSFNKTGGVITHHFYDDVKDEAHEVALSAKKALAKHFSCAVIARTNRDLLNIEASFLSIDVAYYKKEVHALFEHEAVAALFNLLCFVIEPSYQRLEFFLTWIGLPKKVCQYLQTVNQNVLTIQSLNLTVDDKILSNLSHDEIKQTRTLLKKLSEKLDAWHYNAKNKLYRLLYKGVQEFIAQYAKDEYTQSVLDIASRVLYPHEKDMKEHLSTVLNRMKSLKKKSSNDVVHLITAHASKGLEFDWVWVIGLKEGHFPDKDSCIAEERRLCYVAMTRAKKYLTLSGPRAYLASRFLKEAKIITSV